MTTRCHTLLLVLCATMACNAFGDPPSRSEKLPPLPAPLPLVPEPTVETLEPNVETPEPIIEKPRQIAPIDVSQAAATLDCGCTGCCGCQGKFDFSEWWKSQTHRTYAPPTPFGFCVNQNLNQQILNGRVNQQVLYDYDFGHPDELRAGELNERGRYQLEKLAFRMGLTGYPIVIQSTSSVEMDEQRKQVVLNGLAELGLDTTPDDVLVRRVMIKGLGGIGEREFPATPAWSTTYENRLQQTLDRGSRRLLETLQR